MCGGATAFFVYGYCFYYYFARSDMSAFMQTSFFFGYMFMVCYAFFLMLGTVGYRASLLFVRHIYRYVGCWGNRISNSDKKSFRLPTGRSSANRDAETDGEA